MTYGCHAHKTTADGEGRQLRITLCGDYASSSVKLLLRFRFYL
jgi:hypothetical protein